MMGAAAVAVVVVCAAMYTIKTGVRNCAFVHVDVRATKGRWKG